MGTTTLSPRAVITRFPTIDVAHHSRSTKLRALCSAHARRVQAYLARHAGTSAKRLDTPQAMARAQNLMNMMKHDHLRSIGWVTLECVLPCVEGDEALARKVLDIIRKRCLAKSPARGRATELGLGRPKP